MRLALTIQMVYLVGCSAGTSQSEDTTPEAVETGGSEVSDSESGDDSSHQQVLEASRAFGEALGPILATVAEDRNFEACERANELVMRANELRDLGAPEGISDAYGEELANLPRDTNLIATYCGRGVDTLPPEIWVSAELTFYRLLLLLHPSTDGSAESSHITAVDALREALEPISSAHREDRVSRLCERIDQIVPLCEGLEGMEAPSEIPSPRHYSEELNRLVTTTTTTATQCGEGVDTVSTDPTFTLEVATLRLWLMLHRKWPGAL